MRHVPVAAALVLVGTAGSAEALTWNFTFNDGIDTASGFLTTNGLSGGSYLITGITGTYNGLTITGLSPAGTYGTDNLLYPTPTFLDFDGFAFTVASGPSPVIIGGAEGGGGYPFFDYVIGEYVHTPANFSASLVDIPEPATIGLLGAALAGLGVRRRPRG